MSAILTTGAGPIARWGLIKEHDMAFYREPIIEEPPTCIVCKTTMYDRRWEDGLVCSATCADLWLMAAHGPDYDVDPEEALYA